MKNKKHDHRLGGFAYFLHPVPYNDNNIHTCPDCLSGDIVKEEKIKNDYY